MLQLTKAYLFVLLLGSSSAGAANLVYTVNGLEGEAKRNALAWLGAPPDTIQERRNFVISAQDRVERSLQALGYYSPDIEIDFQRSEPAWQMAIAVDAGPQVIIRDTGIQLLGPAAGDPKFIALISAPGFASGDILHHGHYEDFKARILSLGQRRGYLDGKLVLNRVEVEVAAARADIFFSYQSGGRYRFGELVYDRELVDYDLLDALKTFQTGDYYEQSTLLEFQSQLHRTNYFSSVVVQPLRDKAVDGVLPIAVQLQEAKRHSFDVGVGYSTDTEGRVSVTWRTPKINRFGHSQVTRLEYSGINPSGRFTYSIPLSHPLNDILQLWARTEENEFGDLDSRQDELGVRRETRQGNWVRGYSMRGLNESWDVLQVDAANDYLLFGASLSHRTHTGSIVDPEKGFSQLYTLEVGNESLGSDIDLVRFTANMRYVLTPVARHRIVTRADFGVVEIASGDRVELAPSLNFFAGGNQSVRGFSYQSLGNTVDVTEENGRQKTLVVGGDRLVTTSLEYQYYFTDTWRGAVFVDAGDAFDEGEFDVNVGAGFGVHYLSPVGAVRVELANSLSDDNPDWYLHFTIGAEF